MAFIVVHGTNKWREIRWCLGVSPSAPTGVLPVRDYGRVGGANTWHTV